MAAAAAEGKLPTEAAELVAVAQVAQMTPAVSRVESGKCVSNPCKNGGTCIEINSENRYECNCTATFTGPNCDQDLCEYHFVQFPGSFDFVIESFDCL